VEVLEYGGGFANNIKEYLHQFYANFEHELRYDGGSGDSGGSIPTLEGEEEVLHSIPLQPNYVAFGFECPPLESPNISVEVSIRFR